jgi:hypothetical protein
MVEKSFSGSMLGREFNNIGEELFTSEDLLDKVYKVFLELMVDGWSGDQLTLGTLAASYRNGYYIPCTQRVILAGQIDMANDGLPEYSGFADTKNEIICYSVERKSLPRGWVAPTKGEPIIFTIFERSKKTDRISRKISTKNHIAVAAVPMIVKESGEIIPAVNKNSFQMGSMVRGLAECINNTAAVVNAWTDSKHLWLVETSEPIVVHPTPLRLGCAEEHVKSLFYARESPMTETGRKRPILHWVESHNRRLRSGIDIDIRKHMRGVIEFEMDGFYFKITNPIKPGGKS